MCDGPILIFNAPFRDMDLEVRKVSAFPDIVVWGRPKTVFCRSRYPVRSVPLCELRANYTGRPVYKALLTGKSPLPSNGNAFRILSSGRERPVVPRLSIK
jgi:hypothetical protein